MNWLKENVSRFDMGVIAFVLAFGMLTCWYLYVKLRIQIITKDIEQMQAEITKMEKGIAELDEDLNDMVIDIEKRICEMEKATEPEVVEEPVAVSARYFDVPLDRDLQDHIFAECEKYGIRHPQYIFAMIQRESGYQVDAIGDNGKAFGLMQVQPRWHQDRMERLGVTDLLDPYQNVTVGIDFMAELMGYGEGVEWALMAYNSGPSNAWAMQRKGLLSDYTRDVIGISADIWMKEVRDA